MDYEIKVGDRELTFTHFVEGVKSVLVHDGVYELVGEDGVTLFTPPFDSVIYINKD